MNRTVLNQAGRLLWGPRFRADMAREMGVHLATINRWTTGETGIPQHAWEQLAELLTLRKKDIEKVLAKLPDGA